MSAGSFDRFSPLKGGGSGDGVGQRTPDRTPPSGASPQGLTSSPQPLKIVKDIHECIEKLKTTFEEEKTPIDDNNQTLHRFCARLEFLLQYDMKERKSITGRKKDYWDYLCNCIESVKGVNDGIKYVKTVGDCKTSLGKGRAFLRFCLMHHRLADSLQQCVTNGKVTSVWYGPNSIWLQHEKSSGIINALYDLNDVIFDLAPRGYDLDNSWPSFARVDMLDWHPFVTLRSRKNMDGQHSWALSERSRASSISSLNSIGQEVFSPNKSNLMANIDSAELEHLAQELAISENVRSDLVDRMEALEQQKGIFQQSIAESRGELSMLETQHKQLQLDHKELQNSYRELEKKYDIQILETDLKEKDNRSFTAATEEKLQRSEEQMESMRETVNQLQEEIKTSKETLHTTVLERDSLKNESESIKDELEKRLTDMKTKEAEFKQTIDQYESEKEGLLHKVRALEEEKVAEQGNTSDAQKLLQDKNMEIGSLGKTVTAMKHGFQWLKGLRDNQTYTEIQDLDDSTANILKDMSSFVVNIIKQKSTSDERLEALVEEHKNIAAEKVTIELKNNENQKSIENLKMTIDDMNRKELDLQQKISSLEDHMKLEADRFKNVTDQLKEKEKILNEKEVSIAALSAEKHHMVKELDTFERDVSQLKGHVEKTQNELQKTNEFYNLATKGQSDLMEKLNSQEKLISEKDSRIFDMVEKEKMLSETSISLKNDKEKLNVRNEELEKEILNINETKDSVQKVLENTKLELESSVKSRKESDKKLGQIQKKVSKIEKENINLKDVLTQLESDKQTLEKEMEEKIVELKCEISKLENENETVATEMNDSKAQVVHRDGEIILFKARISELENQIASVTESEKQVSEKVNCLGKEVSSKSFSILSLEKDVDTLSKENSQLKLDKENCQDEIRSHQNQLYEKQSEVLLLKEKLERAHNDLERTKEFYETAAKTESDLSERFKSLENNLNEKDNRISQMNEKEKGLTVEITKLNRDNAELEEKLETVKEKLNELSNSNSESLLQIDNLKSTLNDLQTEKEHLVKELGTLRQNEISNQELIENQRVDLEKSFLERGDLDQVIDLYKNKELKLTEHNKQLEHKVFELEQKEIQVGKHLEQMKEDFDFVNQEKENLVEKVEDLDEKILSNEKDIGILNSECDKMNLLKDEMIEKFSESEKRNRQLFETVERLKLDHDIVSKDKYELEEKVEKLEKELLLSKDNVISLKSDISALEELKEEIQSRLESFEQKDVDNVGKIELLTNQVSTLENKSEELMSSLKDVNLLHSEKVTELENLQNAFDKLNDEKQVKDDKLAALIKTDDEKSNLIGSMQDEISTLNSERASLNEDISRLQKEKDDLCDKLERTVTDLKTATIERNEMEQNLAISIENNEETSEYLRTTRSELSDLHNNFFSLQQDNEAEKVESEKLRIETSELLAKGEALRQELMQVKMNYKEAEEKGQILIQDNRQLETEKASIAESLEQLDSKCNKMESELSDSFTKLSHVLYGSLGFDTVNGLKEEKTSETLVDLVKCLDSVCISKMTDMESLQATLGEKDKELNTLIENQKHFELKEKEYLKEVETQSIALKEAEVVETKLQETLKEVDNMAEAFNNLKLDKEALSNDLECETRKYQGLIDEAEREMEQMKLNIVAEKKETEKLRTKGSQDNDVIVVLNNDIEKLNVEKSAIVKELADVRSDFQSECNKLIEEKSYLSQDLTTTKQYLNETEATIKTNKSLIEEQKAHLQNLSESIRQLQESLTESQENYQNVSQSLAEVQNEKENQRQSFTHTVCDLESKQSFLSNQITELESNLQETNEKLEVKSKELHVTIQEKDLMSEKQLDMEGIISDLSSEIENLKQTLLDSNAKAETFKQELELTRQNLSDSENGLNKLSKEHLQMCDIYEKSTYEHDQYKLQVENHIAAALDESKTKLEDITIQKAELTETVDQLKSEKEEIEQKVAQLMGSIEEKDVCVNDTNAKLLEVERSCEEICELNSELKKEINSKDNNISNLEKEIVILNEKCSACELQVKTFVEEAKLTDEKLEELEGIDSEKNGLTAQVKELEEKNNELSLCLYEENHKFQSLKESSEETAIKLTNLESEMDTVLKANGAAVESLKQEIKSLEGELEAVQTTKETELESLRQEVMAMEGTIETLNKTKNSEEESFRREITTLKSEIESVCKDRDIEVESLKQNITALENEIETVRQTKETEVELLKQEMVAIENDLDNVRQTKDDEMESLKQEYSNLESESETVQKSKESEVESLRQEITALEFQLSAEQLQNEEKQKTAQFDETEFVELKDKVMEQEAVIDDLQREMDGLRSISLQHKEQVQQIESLEEEVAEKNRENKILEDRLQQIESRLTTELESSQKVQHSLDDEKQKVEEIVAEKDRQIEELREDIDQLKKKLVKLIKEKDTLWQKTDWLAHQHKLKVTEKWMDGSTVTNCLGCNAEFSFTLRKHHCRLCGRVFCYNCSSHWVMTTSSSKKLRACTACYVQYSAPTEEVKLEGDLEDQSVEIPKRHFIGKAGSLLDTSSMSIASSTTSFSDTEELSPEPAETLGTSDINLGAGNQDTIIQDTAKTGDIGLTLGNETDEDKLRDTSEKGAEEEGDKFHVISDEEIQRSLTMSAEYEGAAEPEPNMSCSMYLNLEELENGDINSQNEVWIKAGRSYAVPVHISKANTVFGWEFTSYPKDVVFSAKYRQNQSEPYKDAQVLVPPCKCDSHKEATRGELTAKQPGVYTLIFDNTYSKMTAKRVNYSLFSNTG